MQGLGYQDARQQRMSEGYTASNMEERGHEEFLVYFGRAHITDFEKCLIARGLLKVGRGKWKTALMRGRNQPGVDFRIYAEIFLTNNDDTKIVEKIVKDNFKDKHDLLHRLPFIFGEQCLFTYILYIYLKYLKLIL